MKRSYLIVLIALALVAALAVPLAAQVNVTNFTNIRADGFVRADTYMRSGTYAQVGTFLNVDAAEAIAVTQNGTITPQGTFQPLSSAGNVGTSSIATPTGQSLLVVWNTTNTSIVLSDTNALKLGGNRTLGQWDTLTLFWNGSDWVELAFTNN